MATLERALEKAREGTVSSVAVAFVYRDGTCDNMWSKLPSYGLMMGAIWRLLHKVTADFDA